MTMGGKCVCCGKPVTVEAVGVFAGAEVVGCLCVSCADRQTIEGGGVVMALYQEDSAGRFPLGKITITRGAVAALADSGEHVWTFLTRHVRGDWGTFGVCDQTELTEDERRRGWEATEDDAKINKSNLVNRRDKIMSGYQTNRRIRLWVITSLDRGGGTTVLLPEEY